MPDTPTTLSAQPTASNIAIWLDEREEILSAGMRRECAAALKNCISIHEAEEKQTAAQKLKKEREAKAKELQAKIKAASDNLQKLVAEYNNCKTGKSYSINIYFSEEEESFDKIFRDLLGL